VTNRSLAPKPQATAFCLRSNAIACGFGSNWSRNQSFDIGGHRAPGNQQFGFLNALRH